LDLGGDIVVAAPLVVPYPLPLTSPSVDRRVLAAQIIRSVSQSGIRCTINRILIAHVRDCRDGWRALLPPHCIVVVGKSNRLSPIQHFRTWLSAQFLRKLGHEVIVA
jgi:hypothetical protein